MEESFTDLAPRVVFPDVRDLRIHAIEQDVAALTKLVRHLTQAADVKPSRGRVEQMLMDEFQKNGEVDIFSFASRMRVSVSMVEEIAEDWQKKGLISET